MKQILFILAVVAALMGYNAVGTYNHTVAENARMTLEITNLTQVNTAYVEAIKEQNKQVKALEAEGIKQSAAVDASKRSITVLKRAYDAQVAAILAAPVSEDCTKAMNWGLEHSLELSTW